MGIMTLIRNAFTCPRREKTPKSTLDPNISPVLIAVIGCTGTGISTFINAITDSDVGRVSPQGAMEAHTSGICPVPIEIEGMRPDQFPVVLVDTPGMDFANGPDFKATFNNLNKWKNDNYGKETTFTGIVFVHRQVNQSLPDGELSIQHKAILTKLCGADWRDKMVLAHNYRQATDHVELPEELLKAEKEWGEGFWKLVKGVDKVQRFDINDRRKSAWKILWSLTQGTRSDLRNNLVARLRDQGVTWTDRLRDIYEALQEVDSTTLVRRA